MQQGREAIYYSGTHRFSPAHCWVSLVRIGASVATQFIASINLLTCSPGKVFQSIDGRNKLGRYADTFADQHAFPCPDIFSQQSHLLGRYTDAMTLGRALPMLLDFPSNRRHHFLTHSVPNKVQETLKASLGFAQDFLWMVSGKSPVCSLAIWQGENEGVIVIVSLSNDYAENREFFFY